MVLKVAGESEVQLNLETMGRTNPSIYSEETEQRQHPMLYDGSFCLSFIGRKGVNNILSQILFWVFLCFG